MFSMPINLSRHPKEPHAKSSSSKLNWLRASVLGANDGIVSISGLVVGVAGATNTKSAILTAGIAGVIAGSLSMAAGEYISVSTQRDTERALLKKERAELRELPEQELAELTGLYRAKGLSAKTAAVVAKELTTHDAFAAHVDAELGIDPNNLTNPWHAAIASAASFVAGSVIPMLAIMIPPQSSRIPVTFVSVIVALVATGALSAKAGDAPISRAIVRVVTGGVLAMSIAFVVGRLFNVAGI
ncbi:VIT family protein [Candidatus Saccharibacteria bacterium]|nr:VIT family protein [Candidatus Saccharibacteria bacterium]